MTTMKELDRKAEEYAEKMSTNLETVVEMMLSIMRPDVATEWRDHRRNAIPCPACGHAVGNHPGGSITRRLNEADICTGCNICGPEVMTFRGEIRLRHRETLRGPGNWSTILRKAAEPLPGPWSANPPLMMDKIREAREMRERVSNPLIGWANRLADEMNDIASRVAKVKPGKAFLDGVEIPHVEMPSFTLPEGSVMAFDFSKVGPLYGGVDDGWRQPVLPRLPKTISASFSTARVDPQAIAYLMGVDPDNPIVRGRYSQQTTNKEKSVMATKKQLEAVIAHAAEKLEKLNRFPETENYPLGTIIGFDARFAGEGSKVYHYAGVKTERGWFITGREAHRSFTWEQLVQFFAEELPEITALVVCSEVEEIIDPVDLGEAYEDGESE